MDVNPASGSQGHGKDRDEEAVPQSSAGEDLEAEARGETGEAGERGGAAELKEKARELLDEAGPALPSSLRSEEEKKP
jgi:hypothetical protein